MSETPFVAFTNDELGGPLKKGDSIKCPTCKKSHVIELGIDAETGKETDLMMFYKCGKKEYLAGIKGQALP